MSEPFFSGLVEALLAGRDIGAATCVSLHFLPETMYVWNGHGDLRTSDGITWKGLGDMADIGPMQLGGLPTEQVTARLTGLENFIPGGGATIAEMMADPATNCAGRLCRVHVVFFDPTAENGWKPVSSPYVLRTFVMGSPIFDIDLGREGETHIVEVPLEPRTLDKHRSNYSIISHLEQQRRYPGDLACERMGKIAGTLRVEW